MTGPDGTRSFLFLQGPTNHLFTEVARQLRSLGHRTLRIHVCAGDELFWRGEQALRYRGDLAGWPAFLNDVLDRHAVDQLVLLGEQRVHHRMAIDVAHRRSIDVAVTDFGYLRPDWVILERDGLNAQSRFPRDPARIITLARDLPDVDRTARYASHAVNQALWDMAFHLSNALRPWRYPNFRRHTLHHPVLNYLGTGLRLVGSGIESLRGSRTLAKMADLAPWFLFAMQMEDDFSIRAYSPYADLDSAMAEAIASFARHAGRDAHLLFKCHPLDPGLKSWRRRIGRMARRHGVTGRVHFIDGGDLDAIIQRCRGVLTVNSTVGLRSLELGRPTLALGQAIYRVEGLSNERGIDRFWTEPQAPDTVLVQAFVRLLAASLHVRGGMYDDAAIQAAADGIVYRLHHGLVNHPLPQVSLGEPLVVRAAEAAPPA